MPRCPLPAHSRDISSVLQLSLGTCLLEIDFAWGFIAKLPNNESAWNYILGYVLKAELHK